jgi:hypothetical protein
MGWQFCCFKTNRDGLNERAFVRADGELFGLTWRFSCLPMRLWVYGKGYSVQLLAFGCYSGESVSKERYGDLS